MDPSPKADPLASYLATRLIKRGGLSAQQILSLSQQYARSQDVKHPMRYAQRNLARVRAVLIEHGARDDGNRGVML